MFSILLFTYINDILLHGTLMAWNGFKEVVLLVQ